MSFASEVCLLLLVTYSALPGWINPHNFRKTYGVADYLSEERQKRTITAAVVIGFRAIKFLTKGARVLESNQHFRLFKKPGGYRQALKDFRSVKPREVHRIFGGKVGQVGDRRVVVEKNGYWGKPTMHIEKIDVGEIPDVKTQTIMYSD